MSCPVMVFTGSNEPSTISARPSPVERSSIGVVCSRVAVIIAPAFNATAVPTSTPRTAALAATLEILPARLA